MGLAREFAVRPKVLYASAAWRDTLICCYRRCMKRLFLGLLLCAATASLRSQAFSGYILAANRTNTAEVIDDSTLETVARIHFDFRVERMSSAGALQLTVTG